VEGKAGKLVFGSTTCGFYNNGTADEKLVFGECKILMAHKQIECCQKVISLVFLFVLSGHSRNNYSRGF